MRILFLCQHLPYPPDDVNKTRSFRVLSHLALKHEVIVATIARDRLEKDRGHALITHCARMFCVTAGGLSSAMRAIIRVPTSEPATFGYFHVPSLMRTVQEVVRRERVELIYVHGAMMAPYVAKLDASIPKILDHGRPQSRTLALIGPYQGFPKSIAYKHEAAKLTKAELELSRTFDLNIAAAPADGVHWLPDGFDDAKVKPRTGSPSKDVICLAAPLDEVANQQAAIWFAQQVLPSLQERRPDVSVVLVGRAPNASVQALALRAGIVVIDDPRRVREFVTNCAVLIAPQHFVVSHPVELLEAMAMSAPTVVSTKVGEYLGAANNGAIPVAGDAGDWVEILDRLLSNPELAHETGEQARAFVLARHSWDASMQRLDELLGDFLAATPAATSARG